MRGAVLQGWILVLRHPHGVVPEEEGVSSSNYHHDVASGWL